MIATGIIEDEEAKRRARSDRDSNSRRRDRSNRSGGHQTSSSEKTRTPSRSGTTNTSPGAYSASSSNEKSRDSKRKAHRSARESDRDHGDSAAKRSARSHGSRSPTRPGAQRSNQRPSSGKATSRSSEKEGSKKSSPTSNIDQEQPSAGATTSPGIDGGEVVAQAILVEDDQSGEEDQNDEVQEYRRRMQKENERQRNQLEQDNEHRRLEMEEIRKKQRDKEKKMNRRRCVVVVLLVLIGGGVGAYFGTQRSTGTQDPVAIDNPNNDGGNTTATVPVTPIPSASPSAAPAERLKYPPPNTQDCQNVAIGLPRDKPNDVDLITSNYQLTLDLESSSSSNLQSLIPSLESQIQRILVSELLGCNDIRRFLRQRKLQGGDIRYVIFSAKVAVQVAEGKTCQDSSTASLSNCSVIQVNLDLSLQGQEFGFLITSMIFDVFDTSKDSNHDNLASKLELPQPQFQSISLNSILPLDPTATPSKSPTDRPSISPTTGRPSETPTRMPTNPPTPGPTTTAPEPTLNPTREETPEPSPPPVNDNCEDIPSYFEGGEYDEYVGGEDSVYILQCDDLIGTNVIGFSVDENGCGFTCVADKKPKDFEPKCGNAPPGTTVDIFLEGDFEGERIFIGIQADGVPKLPCEDPFLVEAEDF